MLSNSSMLSNASVKGDLTEVKALLENEHNEDEIKNAFRFALKFHHTDIVKLFVDRFNVQICNSVLACAVQSGHLEAIELLIKKNVDPNFIDVNFFGKKLPPLHGVSNLNNDTIAEMLIKHGANVNAVYENGNTSLHTAAADGRSDKVEVLLRYGAEINSKNANGHTALHLAMIGGMTHTARFLIAKGADINLTDKEGKKATDYLNKSNKTAANLLESLERFAKRGSKNFLEQTFEEQVKEAIDYRDIKLLQLLLGPKNCQLWQYWLTHSVLSHNILAAIKLAEYQIPIDILIAQRLALLQEIEFARLHHLNTKKVSAVRVTATNQKLQEIEAKTIQHYTSSTQQVTAMFGLQKNYDTLKEFTYPISGDEIELEAAEKELQELTNEFQSKTKFRHTFGKVHSLNIETVDDKFRVKADDKFEELDSRLSAKYKELQPKDEKLFTVIGEIRRKILNEIKNKKFTDYMYDNLLKHVLTIAGGNLDHCLRPDFNKFGKDEVGRIIKRNSDKITKNLLNKFLEYAWNHGSNLDVISVLVVNGASLGMSVFNSQTGIVDTMSAIFVQSSDPAKSHFPNRSAFGLLKEVHGLLFDFSIIIDEIDISGLLSTIPSKFGDFKRTTRENAEAAINEKPMLQNIGEEAEREFMRFLEHSRNSVSSKKSVEEKKLDAKEAKLNLQKKELEEAKKEKPSEGQKFFRKLFRLPSIDEKLKRFSEKYNSYQKDRNKHENHYREFFIEFGRLLETGYLAVASGDDRVIIDHAKRVEKLYDTEKNEDIKALYSILKTILYEHQELVKLSWREWKKHLYQFNRFIKQGPDWNELLNVTDSNEEENKFTLEVKLDCWSQSTHEEIIEPARTVICNVSAQEEQEQRIQAEKMAEKERKKQQQEREMRMKAEEQAKQAREQAKQAEHQLAELRRLLERANINVESIELVESRRQTL